MKIELKINYDSNYPDCFSFDVLDSDDSRFKGVNSITGGLDDRSIDEKIKLLSIQCDIILYSFIDRVRDAMNNK